jgi:hypothetical protein
MDKDTDLLPWILGGLSMATVALAVAVATTDRHPTTTAQALPRAALAVVTQPAVLTAAAPLVESSPMQPTVSARSSTGQIWECTTNGQKTFSNNPCGDKSSLLDVGPINTMDRTPIYRGSRTYQPLPGYAPEYPYGDSQEPADNFYPVVVGVPLLGHRTPQRVHRPYDHDRSSAPRKY